MVDVRRQESKKSSEDHVEFQPFETSKAGRLVSGDKKRAYQYSAGRRTLYYPAPMVVNAAVQPGEIRMRINDAGVGKKLVAVAY
ncbi:MAG: hypothetical protein DMF70_00125 [Acidobacteria bacterium]|nr:MAG: hypothetical protein DMF70_00125 [Acidobacteriota bacterium]